MLANTIRQAGLIVNGWRNWLFRQPEVEAIAARRGTICDRCEHRQPATCGLCGCPIAAKIRSLKATCPDGRW